MNIGPEFPYPSHGHCVAAQKSTKKAFFVGGKGVWGNTQQAYIPGTRVFDMLQRTFSTLPNQMSVGRAYHECTLMEEEGLLIAAGGRIADNLETDSVEILNLATLIWADASALPSATLNVWATREVMFYWDTELYQYEAVSNKWLNIEDVPFELQKLKKHLVQVDAGIGSFCPYAQINT